MAARRRRRRLANAVHAFIRYVLSALVLGCSFWGYVFWLLSNRGT